MASSLQRVGAVNQKACTFGFGASAAANENAGSARVPLGRPAVDFTRSYLVGNSGFALIAAEQLQTGTTSKVPTFAVRATARELLPRPPSGQSSSGLETKQCIECKRAKPLVDFEKSGKNLRRSCRACVAVMRAERSGKEMVHMALSVEESWKKAKPCVGCGLVKELRDFAVDKKAKDGAGNRCRACKSSRSSVVPKNQGSAAYDSLSDDDCASPLSSELSLERQFEVTKNIWESIMAEGEDEEMHSDVAPAASDPKYQQKRTIKSKAASETIAALQVKLLRLDFDLSHARATKAAFSDQIKKFERLMSDSTEENGKMRVALDEAVSSIGELETHVNTLEEEARNLRGRLLRLDFDLTHTRATKSLLGTKVEDLERAIAEDNEASRIRDEKLKTALAEATASNATLRAQVEEAQSEASKLRSKVLTFSLDLDNAQFGKSMLGNKVQDLEKSLNASEEAYRAREAGVKRALDESNVAIAELESLRQSHNTLLSRSIRSDFDLEHQKFSEKVLNDKVADLERVVDDIREEDVTLKAALAKAAASNVELEAQVTGLQEETSKLNTKVLNFSFDLTHSGATRGILSERVKELERLVLEQNEQARARDEHVRTSLAESTKRLAEARQIESEGGILKSKLLRLDLDLAHARAHKDLLGDKVEDLQRMVEDLRSDDATMRAKLAEAVSANTALEAEVTNLQLESTNLRNKVLYLSLDLTHAQAGKDIFSGRVQDLEKELSLKAEVEKHAQTQEEKLQAAHALTAKLEAEVERLSEEEGKLLSQNLRQDFDLAHIKALKGVLDQQVFDIDGAIAARDQAEANMRKALADRDMAESKVAGLAEQRNRFQSQSLRKDFDITHLRAMKAILSDRVADLERAVAVHADIGEKLKDATVDKAELEAEVDRLTEEGRSLQSKLLRKDFDMTHTRALTAILNSKVEDLEKTIAGHKDIRLFAGIRADKAKLEYDVRRLDAERGAAQSDSIRKDFDLMHYQSLKALLEDKVSDLQRVVDTHTDMAQKLKETSMTNATLEAELQRLETQEGALRSQMLARDFDLTHTRALQKILTGRVEDLQKKIDEHEDQSQQLAMQSDQLKAVQADSAKLGSEVRSLGSEVQRLQTRESQLMGQSISKDFDLTHYQALKAILQGRVEDLQKVIATHEDLTEKLKASHLANVELEREVGRLGEEGNGLRSKLLRQDFDLSNTRALKNILNEKVQDLERVIASHDDMGAKLRASKNENFQLEGKVARLEESEVELKTKVLRKDLDLQHYHALKTILDAKVQGLEKAVANLDEAARTRDEKLRVALAEASASSAENAALKEETSSLKYKLFETGLDLTHAEAGKAILNDKVHDLERVLANYDELALARDASLADALSSVAELEAEVQRLEQDRGVMQSKQIRMDFDLAHANAMRGILGDKVVDLESKGEFLSSALTQVISTKTELEGKVGQLSDGLKAVQQEEKSLRGNQAELKRQLFNLQLDNLALHRSTERRTQMLEDKKQELVALESALTAAHDEAAALSRQLEAVVGPSGTGFFRESVPESVPRGPESVGDQLAQIATLTASVGGQRVQIADTDADTDDEVVLSDEESDTEDETSTPSTPETSEEKGAGKGLATAGLSLLLVLALGGSMMLKPTDASTQGPDSNTRVVRSAPSEQVVEVKRVNPQTSAVPATKSAPPVMNTAPPVMKAAPSVTKPAPPVMNSAPPVMNSALPTTKPAPSVAKPVLPTTEPAPSVAKPDPPVAKAAPSVAKADPPVANSASPVTKAAPPVAKAAPPVAKADVPVAKAAPPVAKADPPVAKVAPPVAKAAPPVMKAAPPVMKSSPPITTFAPPVNPIEQVATMMLLAEEPSVEMLEESVLLEVTTATGPTEQQQAEELSLVEEMSSKLFDATPSTVLPSLEAVPNFFEPECKVDMC